MYSLPPYFRLILTFSYFSYEFLRELELGTGRSPDTDKADSFHGQIRWAKLNDFAPDIQDVMELWALGPHARLVKVISVCRLHVFFHQYVADLREERSENVLRTVSASAFLLNMTVMSSSGVIVSPSDVPVRQIQPLTTVVSSTDAGSTVTLFVVPPPPDIEQPVKQLHDFLTYRTPESRQSSFLLSLSASSSAHTLPRTRAKSTVIRLFEGTNRLWSEGPCCRRRQMTVCFRVWMIQTLPAGVSRFQGQNTLLLCLHARRSGLCCQPDPPVLPTGRSCH